MTYSLRKDALSRPADDAPYREDLRSITSGESESPPDREPPSLLMPSLVLAFLLSICLAMLALKPWEWV